VIGVWRGATGMWRRREASARMQQQNYEGDPAETASR
jgi:hypothetical protein